MSTSIEIALTDLKRRFDMLERQRKRLARTVMAQSAVLLVLIVIAGMYFVQRSDARTYYNDQLHNLACLAVKRIPSSESGTIRDLREHYHCRPYQAPTKPGPSKTRTPRALPPAPTSAALSAPPQTVTALPASTASRTPVQPPAPATSSSQPSGTRPSPTPTPSRTPGPTPTRTGLLDPVCGLVHLPILCRTESP